MLFAPAFRLALLFACTAAAAELSEGDAIRIGREANVQGLRALIAQRNQALLYRAMGSWNFGDARELPPALEALAVEHYADPVAQRPLVGQLGQKIELGRHERYPKYRSRKLFELLYADLKAGRDSQHYAIRIISTDLAVEGELMALLPALPPEAANEIVMFLGSRRYAPAVPALQALQARVPHERNVNGMIERIDWALLQIGTAEAAQRVLARLKALGAMKGEQPAHEVAHILSYIQQQPSDQPPGFAELVAALPTELNDGAWGNLVRLIADRKEKAGTPLLLRAIAQSPKADAAVDALLAIGEPADWRAGRAALEQSRLPGERTTPLFAKLDAALSDPARSFAQREERERAQDWERSLRLYDADKRRIEGYKFAEPRRYAEEMRKLLQREEAGASTLSGPLRHSRRDELGREYMALAGFHRFTLRQPDEALALYEAASALRPANAIDMAALGIADTQRFDKRNGRKAIEAYRRAMASFAPPNVRENRFWAGFKRWIEAEIAYVEHGRRFSGAIGPSDIETGFIWTGLAHRQDPLPFPLDAAALSRLAPSQLQIGRALPAVIELEPVEMLRFFEKHDPAGYLTAVLLAFTMAKEPSPYLKAAADTFFRSRGIHTPLTGPANPRYATPEKTWSAFLAAAKRGDPAAMLDCFTFEMQARLEPALKGMSPEELRQIGASFVGFSMQDSGGQSREAAIVRQDKDRRRAGFVTFVRDGAGWKIASM